MTTDYVAAAVPGMLPLLELSDMASGTGYETWQLHSCSFLLGRRMRAETIHDHGLLQSSVNPLAF
jgi:hypothetical protein